MATTTRNTDTKVITGKVRFAYVHVFQPRAATEGQEPKYGVCIMIPKSDKPTLQKIKAAVEAAKEQGRPQWGGKIPTNLKTPLRDGDEDRPDDPDFAGCYFLNANSKMKPGLVDRQRDPIFSSEDFYSGCYGRASINFYPYNVSGNRGVAAGLNNLQKIADGNPMGGRTRAENDFDDWEDGEGETEGFLD